MLIRTDGAGCTHDFLDWLHRRSGCPTRSGSACPTTPPTLLAHDPRRRCGRRPTTPTTQIRDGAWVAELTGLLDLTGWPTGMRVIARKERPHPGAQLRITDVDGHRVTAFATNTTRGQLADLELRHRRRARAEDRIRSAKDTGLTNLPLHDFAQNQIWCAIVALACELTAWMQTARPHRPPGPPVGTQTAPAPAVHRRRPPSPAPAAAACCTSPTTHPGPTCVADAIHRLRALAAPRRSRLTTAPAVPTTRTTPDRGTGAHPSDTRAKPSHPDARITPQRPTEPRPDAHRQPDERSGLDSNVSDGTVHEGGEVFQLVLLRDRPRHYAEVSRMRCLDEAVRGGGPVRVHLGAAEAAGQLQSRRRGGFRRREEGGRQPGMLRREHLQGGGVERGHRHIPRSAAAASSCPTARAVAPVGSGPRLTSTISRPRFPTVATTSDKPGAAAAPPIRMRRSMAYRGLRDHDRGVGRAQQSLIVAADRNPVAAESYVDLDAVSAVGEGGVYGGHRVLDVAKTGRAAVREHRSQRLPLRRRPSHSR